MQPNHGNSLETLPATPEPLDLVWGIPAIAAVINRTPRQTQEALNKRLLPARCVNRRWVASRSKLREYFEGASV